MVEYTLSLDNIFASLSDPTRRDILRRVSGQELSIGEIARPYDLTFAAVSKHLKVLEKANLIIKRRQGKEQIVSISPAALASADEYLDFYRKLWEKRLDTLEQYLNQTEEQLWAIKKN
jgi:DNA-binding transcriptional ArsR family regulator